MSEPYYYDRQEFGRPPRKRKVWPWALAAVAALCGFGGVTAAVNGNSNDPAVTVAASGEPTGVAAAGESAGKAVQRTAATAAKPATVGAGTWEVGTEVKPGTYTATAAEHCYWARLKGFDGDFESIIANGNLDPGQHGRVTVKKTDKGLELSGDCTWKRAG